MIEITLVCYITDSGLDIDDIVRKRKNGNVIKAMDEDGCEQTEAQYSLHQVLNFHIFVI